MIVVDTSIWADHFRRRDSKLASMIERDELLQHPYVTGELALGNATDASKLVDALDKLEPIAALPHAAVMAFALQHALGGTGISYADAHILAATADRKGLLWTRDKRLAQQAERLGLRYQPD